MSNMELKFNDSYIDSSKIDISVSSFIPEKQKTEVVSELKLNTLNKIIEENKIIFVKPDDYHYRDIINYEYNYGVKVGNGKDSLDTLRYAIPIIGYIKSLSYNQHDIMKKLMKKEYDKCNRIRIMKNVQYIIFTILIIIGIVLSNIIL